MSDVEKVLTKVCPRCAEEIKQSALVCHYCGYEFVGAPVSDTSQPPGYPVATYGQPAPPRGNLTPAFDPRLLPVMAEYEKKHYKVMMGAGDTATMERPATKFNWLLMLMLLFLFGVGSLIYLLIWGIWGVHRTYRVMLNLGPQGEVQEVGDVLAVFDRDRLKAHRVRCIGFGVLFAVVGVLFTIASVGTVVAPSAGTEPTSLGSAIVGWLIIGALPIAIAAFLFNVARKAKAALETSSPIIATEAPTESAPTVSIPSALPEATTSLTATQAAPAGWYQQPDGRSLYWDGTDWVMPSGDTDRESHAHGSAA